jgi:putative CocE/NonD family hydrolase
MRDGVELDTYVYLPEGEGPYPTLVVRTLYGVPIGAIGGYPALPGSEDDDDDDGDDDDGDDDDDDGETANVGWPLLNERGYALVIQVTRGRFASSGVDRSWLDDGPDGYDLVEWVATQPWSDGKIGLFGDSATGASALLAAAAKPPSLDAVYVQVAPGNVMGEDFLPNDGADKLESLMVQGASISFDVGDDHLAARGIAPDEAPGLLAEVEEYLTALFQGLEAPTASPAWMALPIAESEPLSRLMPFWESIFSASPPTEYREALDVTGKIDVPVYAVTVWQDVFLKSSMKLYRDLEERGVPARLMVLNGTHYDIDDPALWPKTVMLEWFDIHLRGRDVGAFDGPPVEYQVQEAGAAVRTAAAWPPASEGWTHYLNSDGTLGSAPPSVDDAGRSFVYDPALPMPTVGGLNLLASSGIQDQTALAARTDRLSYVGEPLDADALLTGEVEAHLFVATSAVDTDFMIKLLDIHPDGTAYAIAEDQVRLRNRAGRDSPSLVTPGEPLDLRYDLGALAYLVRAGHRIGVAITSSDFPAWDRNLNTGESGYSSTAMVIATNTVFSDAGRPSSITLPLVPLAP